MNTGGITGNRRQLNSATRTNLVALLLLKLQFQLGARSRNLIAANQPTVASCLTAALKNPAKSSSAGFF
ncbi:Protein of unknown function [Lactobacillus equicursoris DSM 19284 = JCM 14600 = CIP 110162]|nr:Protein of unknown function [Lactobacillus equicursoris DSM 19284 = JCM 14600 = CIP 110162]